MKISRLERGDDIVVSYLIKKVYNYKFLKTITGQVLNLPEGDVGLNKHPLTLKNAGRCYSNVSIKKDFL